MSRLLNPAACRTVGLTLCLVSPVVVDAQSVVTPGDTLVVDADARDVVGAGQAAQALFERRRAHHLPVSLAGASGSCDEHVGRFCTWYGEGEWYPTPEAAEIVELRTELLTQLDTLQTMAPGDPWLLGQRVWYRSEGGDWEGALGTAEGCTDGDGWWCRALRGFALHGLGRYVESDSAFRLALSVMDDERARQWRIPRRAIDSEARRLIDDAEAVSTDSVRTVLERMWRLADPLYLADGNDRRTAHYARWTVAVLRERARNPFRLRWGDDLEELTVRHGWEMGWERSTTRDFTGLDHIVGHKHPEGRDYMPPGSVLAEPATSEAENLVPDRRRPKSLYAPEYAPVLLPMDGQLAVFPRGEETVLVSTHFLPDDTTFHAGHRHSLPWSEPGDQAGWPDRIGLFAVPAAGGRTSVVTARGRVDGALMLTVPTDAYVVSAESWSPERRRAGRKRMGVVARPAPEDIATLSDILMLRRMSPEPTSLEEALEGALGRAHILPGQTFSIAWEVAGLGFRPETLVFEVAVERSDRGVFRRIGEFLRLADRPQPLSLSWEELGPDQPTHHFRYLDLDLPALDPGEYRVRLTLRTANRSDAVTIQPFEVVERS